MDDIYIATYTHNHTYITLYNVCNTYIYYSMSLQYTNIIKLNIYLHYITLQCITLQNILFKFLSNIIKLKFNYITFHYISLHFITLHSITLNYIIQHFIKHFIKHYKLRTHFTLFKMISMYTCTYIYIHRR